MNFKYFDIIDAIQFIVDKITEEEYSRDECKPKFTVLWHEIFNEDKSKIHQILLAIEHLGENRSRVIFPNLNYNYGYESLQDEMKWLYNSTM